MHAGIASLATEFASLAETAPYLVHLAFQGRLFEAAAQVPPSGVRTTGDRISRAAVLDLLEEPGRCYVVESLLISADDAARRIFETTGYAFLDENGGAKITKGCILKRMDHQLDLLLQAIKLYGRKCDIEPDDPAAEPFSEELLLTTCGRLEEELFRIHGEQTRAALTATRKGLLPRIVMFRRGLSTLKGQTGFRGLAAWKDRGPDPLQMLWLNISFAVEWLDLRFREEEKPKGKKPSDNAQDRELLDQPVTRLRFALGEATARRQVKPQPHHCNSASLVGRLFLSLRHLEVQDPNSVVVKRFHANKQVSSLLETFREIHAEQAAKHAGKEPWSVDVSTRATKEYNWAASRREFCPLADAFATEAEGIDFHPPEELNKE